MTTATLARRNSRHTPAGPSSHEENWASPRYSQPDPDPRHRLQQRISMRSTAAASHTEAEADTNTPDAKSNNNSDQVWWQAGRRSSSLDPQQETTTTAEQQETQPAPPVFMAGSGAEWPGGPVATEYSRSGGHPHNNGAAANLTKTSGNLGKTTAGYMTQPSPFDNEDRLEIFSRRSGGFGGPEQSTPGGGGGSSESVWRRGGQDTPASVAPAAGDGLEAWSSTCGGIADPTTSGMASWARQVGGGEDGGCGGGGHHDLRQGEPESVSGPSQRLHEMKEYFRRNQQASTDSHDHHRNSHQFIEGTVFRSRSGAVVHNNRREGDGEGGQAKNAGGGGGAESSGGSIGNRQQQQQQQSERAPWHEGGTNTYTSPLSGMSAAKHPLGNPPAVGIDGGDNDSRVWEVGTSSAAGGASGGIDSGDVGVEFDPQADCRPIHSGQGMTGGSPSSWWKDVPEPSAPNFPWDLQLPHPAPPLALSNAPSLGGVRGGQTDSSSMAAITGGSLSAAAAVLGGQSVLRGASQEHSPICRCETCRFGKTAAATAAAVHSSRHHRAEQRLQQQQQANNAMDMIDAGGSSGSGGRGGNGMRGGTGAVLMDAAARGTYGGLRWGVNQPPSSVEMAWGLGGGNNGGYLSNRKTDDMRRGGGAPSCDTLVPPGPHAPSYNVVPANPKGMMHVTSPLGGSDRFVPHEFKSLSVSVGGGGGVADDMGAFGSHETRAKRSRMSRREEQYLPSGESMFGHRMERDTGRGGAGGPESRDAGAGGGGRVQRGRRTPASSRRCRHEGCQSHPNFGVEGDRRALYCAKHKLQGMINVKAPRCRESGCTRNPVYGHAGDPRATFCLAHKSPDMVDVKNRCCEHPGCKHQPSFGMIGDRRANFCFAHKLPSHVNIRRARARAN